MTTCLLPPASCLRIGLGAALALIASASVSHAQVVRKYVDNRVIVGVDINTGQPLIPDGESWATRTPFLQAAIDDAYDQIQIAVNSGSVLDNEQAFAEIWVTISPTPYKPVSPLPVPTGLGGSPSTDLRDRTIRVPPGVHIYGGFQGPSAAFTFGEDSPDERTLANARGTVFSGDLGVIDDPSDNAYSVVYVEGPEARPIDTGSPHQRFCVLDSVAIKDGYANGTGTQSMIPAPGLGTQDERASGARVFIHRTPTELRLVSVTDCDAQQYGGAVRYTQSRDVGGVIAQRCTFANNSASFGGAVALWGTRGFTTAVTTRIDSPDPDGRTITSLSSCTFTGNLALDDTVGGAIGGGDGGAIWIGKRSAPIVVMNSIFYFNNAVRRGSAVFCGGLEDGPTLSEAVVEINHSTIVRNHITGSASAPAPEGYGVYFGVWSQPPGADYDTVVNSIVLGNTQPGFTLAPVGPAARIADPLPDPTNGTPIVVRYSDLEGGGALDDSLDNIEADPMFAPGFFSLSVGSPCIDTGSPVPSSTDDFGAFDYADADGSGRYTISTTGSPSRLPLDWRTDAFVAGLAPGQLVVPLRLVNGRYDMGAFERQPEEDAPGQ
ncbi:MAG: hypothetical protein AAFU73_24015 [Planctomycetota bacterium]